MNWIAKCEHQTLLIVFNEATRKLFFFLARSRTGINIFITANIDHTGMTVIVTCIMKQQLVI